MSSVALVLPAVFAKYLMNNADYIIPAGFIQSNVVKISRGVAIISLIGYIIYVGYQTMTHDGLFHEIYEADEHKDRDRHEELAQPKLTLIEALVALVISLACVSLIAVFLVHEIHFIVERGVSDAFIGLILVPLVEKLAGMCGPHCRTAPTLTLETRTSTCNRRSLRQPNQHGHGPRLGRFHPNSAAERPASCACWLGSQNRHGLQLRHLRCRRLGPGRTCRRILLARWQV
jgi:hypothetical protein